MMRTANFILTIMFIGFSAVQINDPDPIVWILIYGSMAAVCMMAAFEYYIKWLMIIQAAMYVAYAALLFSSFKTWLTTGNRLELFEDISKKPLYFEETREFLGLVICLSVLGLYGYRSRRRNS